MDIAFSTLHTALNEAKDLVRTIKQTEKLREELQQEASSTQSMINKLENRLKEIKPGNYNGSLNPTTSLQALSDINDEVQSLQKAVKDVRAQLDAMNHSTGSTGENRKRKRIGQLLHPEKGKDEAQALLNHLRAIRTSANSLIGIIPIHRVEIKLEEQGKTQEKRARDEDERRRQETEKQNNEKSAEEREALIDWLKPFDYDSKHQSSVQLRHEETCGWLLENSIFKAWRSGSSSRFLWLYGIPGSGKTTLFSKVIDDLEYVPDTTIAYHYCDFMNTDSLVPSTILRSIFVQILLQTDTNWLEEFKELSLAKKRRKNPPSGLRELVDLIQRASKSHQRVIIAIDALDECQPGRDRKDLLDFLRLDHAKSDSLSVFVTSRDEQVFYSAFGDQPFISLSDVNIGVESDIQHFVSAELKKHHRIPESRKTEIMEIIVQRAQGMFQMARCLIDLIDNCYSSTAIATLESDFPRDLNETYRRLLKNINLKDQDCRPTGIAQRVLMWLFGSTRPLHILELYEAIMIEPGCNELNEDFRMIDPSDLLVACGSLVQSFDIEHSTVITLVDTILDKNLLKPLALDQDVLEEYQTTYVCLSHYTVKEYLQNIGVEDMELSAYCLSPEVANHNITLQILTYLASDLFDDLESKIWSRHKIHSNLSNFMEKYKAGILFPYAIRKWQSHLAHYQDLESHDLYMLLQHFFKKCFNHLFENIEVLQNTTIKVGIENDYLFALLLFAIIKPMTWVVKHILKDHPEIAHYNPCKSTTPLIIGIENGRTGVVQVLLEAGADPEGTVDNEGKTPLHYAISSGQLEILTMLIKAGANPRTIYKGRTALHQAALYGRLKISIILLQLGANPNTIDDDCETALHHAASHGYWKISTVLIQAGANPNTVNNKGRTPLHDSVSNGHLEATTMLIKAGADLNTVNENGITPLYDAVSHGYLNIVKILIQAGANPKTIGDNGRTALHKAASCGYLKTLMILLKAGANSNTVDNYGDTALHNATLEGYWEISMVLIQAGTNPNAINKKGKTPLHYAASYGHSNIAIMLIQAGSDPRTVDKKGRTPLHSAALGCHLEILEVLIQDNIELSVSKTKSGITPLHIAINLHSAPMIECLLSAGASLAALGPIYNEQVEWAKEMPWYSQIILKSFDYSSPVDKRVDVISAHTVLDARLILQQHLQLPLEVVSKIFDLSEYWAHSFILQKKHVQVFSENPMKYLSCHEHEVVASGMSLG